MHKVDNNKQTIDKRDFGVGTMPSFLLLKIDLISL